MLKGKIYTDLFTEEGVSFTLGFYQFNDCKYVYPLCVDKNAKAYFGERYKDKQFKHEAYLFVPYDEYITSLFYFTGDKHFNQYIRRYAKSKGYRLNEHGLYKKDKNGNYKKIENIKSEKDIFNEIGYNYIKPSNRQFEKFYKK